MKTFLCSAVTLTPKLSCLPSSRRPPRFLTDPRPFITYSGRGAREWQKEKLALAWNRAAFIGHLCYGLLKQPFPLFLYVFFFFYACAAVPTMPFKSFCNRPLGWPCPSSFNHGVFYFRLQSSSWRRLWVKQRGFFACLCLLQPREMLSFANLRSAV